MNYSLFLMPLAVSFIVAVFILIAIILFGRKNGEADLRIESRHVHRSGISRFGGVALIISFIIAVLIDRNLVIDAPLVGLILALVLILFFGVIDDLRQLSWRTQFFFQIALVLFVYFIGIRLEFVSNPFGGI